MWQSNAPLLSFNCFCFSVYSIVLEPTHCRSSIYSHYCAPLFSSIIPSTPFLVAWSRVNYSLSMLLSVCQLFNKLTLCWFPFISFTTNRKWPQPIGPRMTSPSEFISSCSVFWNDLLWGQSMTFWRMSSQCGQPSGFCLTCVHFGSWSNESSSN